MKLIDHRLNDQVICGSRPITTANAGGTSCVGWMYGMHILGDRPPSRCPHCGIRLGQKPPSQFSSQEKP